MKVVVLNDCSADGHFGCELVIANLLKGLAARDVEVLKVVPLNTHWNKSVPEMDQADLIIVNGEGSIHHGRHMELLDVANHYPSVLINAVYQDMPHNTGIHAFKYISVRESLSQEECPALSVVVPDLIFMETPYRVGTPSTELLVTDRMNDKCGIRPTDKDFLAEVAKAKALDTGRFHAVCLAMMWDTPFTAHPSNTHKIEGMLKDMESCNSVLRSKNTQYVQDARTKINVMLDDITDIARERSKPPLNGS